MLKVAAMLVIAAGLISPALAQAPKIAGEDLAVPFGDGQIFVRNRRPDQDRGYPSMIDAYHGKADYPAPGSLAVNPFAPTVQTAARLRED